MKDIYDKLRDKTKRIVKEGEKLLKRKKMPSHYCQSNCASCLAVEARGIVDEIDYEGSGFNSREDICMLEARDILAKKYKLKVN